MIVHAQNVSRGIKRGRRVPYYTEVTSMGFLMSEVPLKCLKIAPHMTLWILKTYCLKAMLGHQVQRLTKSTHEVKIDELLYLFLLKNFLFVSDNVSGLGQCIVWAWGWVMTADVDELKVSTGRPQGSMVPLLLVWIYGSWEFRAWKLNPHLYLSPSLLQFS